MLYSSNVHVVGERGTYIVRNVSLEIVIIGNQISYPARANFMSGSEMNSKS